MIVIEKWTYIILNLKYFFIKLIDKNFQLENTEKTPPPPKKREKTANIGVLE